MKTSRDCQQRFRPSVKKLVAVGGAVAVASVATGCGGATVTTRTGAKPLELCLLLDQKTGWTALGREGAAAAQIAASDFTLTNGTPVSVKTIDSGGGPQTAAAGVTKLAGQGCKVIVGPGTSAEAQAALTEANRLGVILISPGSTASKLAIKDDNLLRLVPDDRVEARAIVALMAADGIDTLVPVWRDDLGNAGLHSSVTAEFKKLRGPASVTAGVPYSSTKAAGFGSQAKAIAAQVSAAPSGKTGVYLAGFGEAAQVVSAAAGVPVAVSVPWYGGDGIVGDPAFTKVPSTVSTVEKVGLPAPQYALNPQNRSTWQGLFKKIQKASGIMPDAFGLVTYDSATLALNSLSIASQGDDAAKLRQVVTDYANAHEGVTGTLKVNSAGDRLTGPFNYWQVCGVAAEAAWGITGLWSPDGGTLGSVVHKPACKQ